MSKGMEGGLKGDRMKKGMSGNQQMDAEMMANMHCFHMHCDNLVIPSPFSSDMNSE